MAKIYAVCNGSNGTAAVDYVQELLDEQLQKNLQYFIERYEEVSELIIYNTLINVLANINSSFHRRSQHTQAGTGINGFLILEEKVWPFNLGSSRTVLNHCGSAQQLTQIVPSSDQRFHPAMLRRGACKEDILDTPPRGIGFSHYSGISARPKVYCPILVEDLAADHYFILSTEGLNNLVDPQTLNDCINQIGMNSLLSIARNTVYSALQAKPDACLTVLVVKLKKESLPELLHRVR